MQMKFGRQQEMGFNYNDNNNLEIKNEEKDGNTDNDTNGWVDKVRQWQWSIRRF